ncbi:MAG TPA: class I SAM-dependent methyltransferase [Micropepsaceae bacterium]|nr:class I SAM-dependent methyltransferase [Micropepsaceae bacterium]
MTPRLQLYDKIGSNYAQHRKADPRIAAAVTAALGNARTVLNLGAGAGSYEPRDRRVVAVEPSTRMIAQRPKDSAPVVRASAMALPFRDDAFDAAMAILTIHHWPDRERGLAEMKRVAHRRCVILTWEPPETDFWLTADYLPHFLEADRKLFPPWFRGGRKPVDVRPVPIPGDCTDGFLCAYWRRPEAYLDPNIRAAISVFDRVGDFDRGLARLRDDLASGTWHRRYGYLLGETERDLGYRLIVIERWR